MHNIQQLKGKAAVYVRGFMEAYESGVEMSDCQEAGRDALKALGDDLSPALVSRYAQYLHVDRVIMKIKTGRRYRLADSTFTKPFIVWLKDNPDWGSSLTVDWDQPEIFDMLKNGGLAFDGPVSTRRMRLVMALYQRGVIDMVFSDPKAHVYTEHADGKMKPVEVFHESKR